MRSPRLSSGTPGSAQASQSRYPCVHAEPIGRVGSWPAPWKRCSAKSIGTSLAQQRGLLGLGSLFPLALALWGGREQPSRRAYQQGRLQVRGATGRSARPLSQARDRQRLGHRGIGVEFIETATRRGSLVTGSASGAAVRKLGEAALRAV